MVAAQEQDPCVSLEEQLQHATEMVRGLMDIPASARDPERFQAALAELNRRSMALAKCWDENRSDDAT
jgi:hypothetical protein